MYQGLDKGGGGTVGGGNEVGKQRLELSGAVDTTSVDEILVCEEDLDDGATQKVFMVSAIDPTTGSLTWERSYDEDKVMRRTIGMSQMVSMLHDRDRNHVYEESIRILIQNFQSKMNRSPTVLDIGSGTGLLSMMSVRHGASYVIGCEMFEAIAEVAGKVLQSNNMDQHISIVPAKSSDISELPFSPDLIVSEILDSALLGEAVLFSHADAIGRLVDQDPSLVSVVGMEDRVIPHSANMYAVLVQSEDVFNFRSVEGFSFAGSSPFRSDHAQGCVGGTKLVPVHWDQIERRGGRKLSLAEEFMSFEFFHQGNEALSGSNSIHIESMDDGIIHGVLLFWEAFLLSPTLDPKREKVYSTEPGKQNWQDHWLQMVHPLSKPIVCKKGEVFKVSGSHDGMNVFLAVEKDLNVLSTGGFSPEIESSKKRLKTDMLKGDFCDDIIESLVTPSPCLCGWHLLMGAERIQMINDRQVKSIWENSISSCIDKILAFNNSSDMNRCILDMSDGSLLAIMAGNELKRRERQGFLDIYSVEEKDFSSLFFSQLINANNLDDFITILSREELKSVLKFEDNSSETDNLEDIPRETKVSALFCECFFYQMHSHPLKSILSFLYMRESLNSHLDSNFLVCPQKAFVMAAAFELDDMFISHGKAGMVNGFDHSALDKTQFDWSSHLFPYKLGTYSKKILSEPTCIAELNYIDGLNGQKHLKPSKTHIKMNKNGKCHCMAVWVDFQLTETDFIRYWNDDDFPFYLKTLVKFFPDFNEITTKNKISCEVELAFGKSDFDIKFSF